MKFKWRLENRGFAPVLQQWWEERKFAILPAELLPNRIYIVSNDDIDIYAIPVYTTDSEFAWMGFPTGNPEIKNLSKEERSEAFQYLMNVIETTMKYNGFTRLITTSFNQTIMDGLEEREFQNTEQTNFYLKIL